MIEILKNYINGSWTESDSGETFVNEDPSRRGSELNRAQASTEDDIGAAVTAATKAFPAWSNSVIAERQAYVSRFLDALADSCDELAEIMVWENGKTIREAHG